jgi:hypothetical protein
MNKRVVNFLRKSMTVAAIGMALVFALTWMNANIEITTARPQGSQDEKPFDQEQKLSELRKKIAGQENKPAEAVFKNIQLLKGVPAGRLLKVMEIGYSRSLGVNCTHCHLVDLWERDDKTTKQVTREMILMTRAINNDYLKKMKNLQGENPAVNCTTCHRGQTIPALDLP